MTRPSAVVIVSVVALVFAALASWGVYSYLQQTTQKAKAIRGENVVVSVAEIPIGTKLNATQVKLAAWPKDSMPPGSITDLKAVEGRTCVRPLQANEPITEHKLMPKEGSAGSGVMTYRVPNGHRAVTVGVNEVAGVAGFLAPDNRVDVVLTTPIPGTTTGESVSKIILQNVPVLATGQIADQKEGKPVVVPTVTLDLLPEEAENLVQGASKGTLQLLLRNALDTAKLEPKGATIIKVLGSFDRPGIKAAKTAAVAPARRTKGPQAQAKPSPPQPAPMHNVEIIKGKDRSNIQFRPSAN